VRACSMFAPQSAVPAPSTTQPSPSPHPPRPHPATPSRSTARPRCRPTGRQSPATNGRWSTAAALDAGRDDQCADGDRRDQWWSSFTVRLAVTDSAAATRGIVVSAVTNREPACGFRRRRHDVMALDVRAVRRRRGAAPATPIKSASRRRARNKEPRTGVTVLVYRPFGGYR
jgi:hypothetical protein